MTDKHHLARELVAEFVGPFVLVLVPVIFGPLHNRPAQPGLTVRP